MIVATLPSYERDPASPPLPAAGSGIVLRLDGEGLMSQALAHGSYRVTAAERALLGPEKVRKQLWIVAVHRETRVPYWSAPARDAVVFSGEEPAGGDVEGWFHVALTASARVPENLPGRYDVTAVLGPWASKPIAVTLRRG
jgi:hypothetical protein